MTERNELRYKCAKAIKASQVYMSFEDAFTALDSLHGIARLVPIKATQEIIDASYYNSMWWLHRMPHDLWFIMTCTGDLTNPPEEK